MSILHISTSRGDDELGDGSIEAPYLSVEQADLVRDFDDWLCVVPDSPQDLTGQQPSSDSSFIVAAAALAGLAVGHFAHRPLWALLGFVVVAVLFVWLDRRSA